MIKVKVVPRSSRDEVTGLEGDILKIRVTDPPVEGAANSKVVTLLAKRFGLSKSDVEIVAGSRSRVKLVKIDNLSLQDVRKSLEKG
jgi:hypothetical protein